MLTGGGVRLVLEGGAFCFADGAFFFHTFSVSAYDANERRERR